MSTGKSKAFIGACGWSYDDWEGSFYPAGTGAGDRLEVYGKRFKTLEIDSTFYGIPRMETVQKWREQTPPGFIFSAKFPKLVTHERRLMECGEVAQAFVEVMSELGDKLGALVLQLPPSMSVDGFDDLARFLEGLPDGYLYALEVRNRSWLVEPFAELLKRWQVSLVLTDGEHLERFWRVTSQVVYIRWLGQWNGFERYDRLQREVEEDLGWWLPRMEHFLGKGGTILGYVNNNFAGYSPTVIEKLERALRQGQSGR